METKNSILNSETQVIYQNNNDCLPSRLDRIGVIGLLQKTLLNFKSLGEISLSKEEQEVSIV